METIELSFTMYVTEESKSLCTFLDQYGFRTDYKRNILVDFKLGYFVATIGTHLQAYPQISVVCRVVQTVAF